MRAILLQKDDYGLQKDRLHGRYGLTGKPTLTQTSIAGSLGTSFSAGQEVTLTNLRSLTAKIKEAQAAMTGTTANIRDIADNIQKTNEASGEVSKILNNNTWRRFWEGQISPQQFYAIKYYEDESNERMLGEPGFPCLNSSEYPCLLPRTPFWDHMFEIRDHKTDPASMSDDDYCFINQDGDLATKIALSANLRDIKTKAAALNAVLAALGVITAITAVALSGAGWAESGGELVVGLLITEAAIIVVDKLIDALMTREVTELGGKKGRGVNYLGERSRLFAFQNWYEVTMMDPNTQTLLDTTQSTIVGLMSAQAAASALGVLGLALQANPFTAGVGKALSAACAVVTKYTTKMLEHTAIPTIIMVSAYIIGGICTRSPGYDPKSSMQQFFGFKYSLGAEFAKYANIVNPTPYDTELYTSYGTAGQLDLDTASKIYNIPYLKGLIQFTLNIQSSITNTLGYAFSWILKERYLLGNTGFDRNSSEMRIYNYLPYREAYDIVLEDNWGTDRPIAKWQYNLPNFQAVGAGTYSDGELKLTQGNNGRDWIEIRARVYNGNIYKVKAFDKHTITSTVVLKSHMLAERTSSGHQWEYFSELALVALDGDNEHLYLHHERNAIYNVGSVQLGKSDPTHIEQSIWNFDFKSGHSKMFSNRSGRRNYAFIDFADGVKIQYRPLTEEPKENMLSGELINTEYKYNNYYTYSTEEGDFSASEIGGLQSYGNVKNR